MLYDLGLMSGNFAHFGSQDIVKFACAQRTQDNLSMQEQCKLHFCWTTGIFMDKFMTARLEMPERIPLTAYVSRAHVQQAGKSEHDCNGAEDGKALSVTFHCGLAMAMMTPGRPPPDPTSMMLNCVPVLRSDSVVCTC